MGTMGAVTQHGRTFLLQNSDSIPSDLKWAYSDAVHGAQAKYELSDNKQHGVYAGLNSSGLSVHHLAFDRIDGGGFSVLNQAILAECSAVENALAYVEQVGSTQLQMPEGNILLGDAESIAVIECVQGQMQRQILTDGLLARANHPALSEPESSAPNSQLRSDRMSEFLEGLYAWLPTLDNEDVIERCRAILRQEPIFSENTRVSFVVDVDDGRVDYALARGVWSTFWMRDAK